MALERNKNLSSNPISMRDRQRKVAEIAVKISLAEKTGSYESIHQELLKKRLNWYGKNKYRLKIGSSEVRKAYTLFLIDYLGLSADDVPVVYEDERKIVWRSYNFCPVLEACKKTGLDTRKVCREGWEKSVQELMSAINPDLKFSRNYERIRPYTDFCEETIELSSNRT